MSHVAAIVATKSVVGLESLSDWLDAISPNARMKLRVLETKQSNPRL